MEIVSLPVKVLLTRISPTLVNVCWKPSAATMIVSPLVLLGSPDTLVRL